MQLAKAVEKAIKTSPLSLNAVTEGSEVLVKLPRMTQETIDRMVKLVHMEAEGAHQSIRRARQKGMDAVKKAFKAASQDEKKRQEKEVSRGRQPGSAVTGEHGYTVDAAAHCCRSCCSWLSRPSLLSGLPYSAVAVRGPLPQHGQEPHEVCNQDVAQHMWHEH